MGGNSTPPRRAPRKRKPMRASPKLGPCVYCGVYGSLTTDHVIPLSRGGTSARDNLTFCCAPCNSKKGDWLLSELPSNWIQLTTREVVQQIQRSNPTAWSLRQQRTSRGRRLPKKPDDHNLTFEAPKSNTEIYGWEYWEERERRDLERLRE